MKIKRVIICGLGAVGVTYANKLKDVCDLYILADSKRVQKYYKEKVFLNGKQLDFNYIVPEDKFDADLIIIATKYQGLDSAIEYIKNFVGKNTIMISLINGISSEKQISQVYGEDKVLHSYFVGHSAVRNGNRVTQDGVGKIVFGSPYEQNNKKVESLKEFFEENGIDYEIPDDILYSMWLKFAFNTFANQLSAVMKLSFGDMKKALAEGDYFINLAGNIIDEVGKIAEKEGIQNTNNLKTDTIKLLDLMSDDGKTSMLQDILAKRKTEVDLFAGEIIRLGKIHNVNTPYNQVLYDMIKILSCEGKL